MFLLLVTLISLILAVIMSVIAWRMSREERRRSEARVAALAADIHDGGSGGVRRDAPALERDLPIRTAGETMLEAPITEMFAGATATKTSSRLATVVTIGLVVFGLTATAAVLFGRGAIRDAKSGRTAEQTSGAPDAVAPNPPAVIPLELIALGHEREAERLIVRGVVRNPAAGREVDGLTAVVFLFKADGGFAGSGRAAISPAALVPGGESTFLVTVPGATDVARYRVSFRTDDRVVPHVDRRDRIQAKS